MSPYLLARIVVVIVFGLVSTAWWLWLYPTILRWLGWF